MVKRALLAAIVAAAIAFACVAGPRAQTPLPSPTPSPSASPSAAPTALPTQPPIVVVPASAQVPVGSTQSVRVMSALGQLTLAVSNKSVVDAAVDQTTQIVTLSGKAPGNAVVTVTDQRGISAQIPVRVAFNAGSIADAASIRITGDPASPEFIKQEATAAAGALVQVRPGAQAIVTTDVVQVTQPLQQDNIAIVDVPVLIQGDQYFTVQGTTHVRVENVAAPAILPDSLMVSDFPERLTENGILFAADLQRTQPSRFLYFHFNPLGEPARRVVLRAENRSAQPALLQFISGQAGPGPNEMEVGHSATKRFLERQLQNEGRIIAIAGNGTLQLAQQDLPPNAIVCGLLQLRVLNGTTVHLTLFAQNATSSPDEPLSGTDLLQGTARHARGVYQIPEFHYTRTWSVNDEYLELPIGDIPLPNVMQGEALSGDYGVKQSFVVSVQNPTSRPVPIAIYENPRGGRATGTYVIDGVLIQSHGVPAFSRYKIRQYVVPARGFVRVTIVTIPESGSSYPLRLIFAPDDGSVAPGAPGSPIY
ncbi:MAG TPA: hypothetical protein VFO29_11085 [Candidatus Rubrimentiphilum sp.]|nr:hypothetical protein [Candidatus Rubrimentiphilum sp.]